MIPRRFVFAAALVAAIAASPACAHAHWNDRGSSRSDGGHWSDHVQHDSRALPSSQRGVVQPYWGTQRPYWGTASQQSGRRDGHWENVADPADRNDDDCDR